MEHGVVNAHKILQDLKLTFEGEHLFCFVGN